jgi:hypothetical protein
MLPKQLRVDQRLALIAQKPEQTLGNFERERL